jgi:hypothetical protein
VFGTFLRTSTGVTGCGSASFVTYNSPLYATMLDTGTNYQFILRNYNGSTIAAGANNLLFHFRPKIT